MRQALVDTNVVLVSEDSATAAAAQVAGCAFIVTRDPKGFRESPIRPLTPEAFLPLLHRLQ